MRTGAEYFTEPASPAQRRYEALRAYFLDEMPAAEVADRFGYSTASIHQMATLAAPGPADPVRRGPGPARKARARPPARCASGCWSCAPPGIPSPRSPPRSPARACRSRRRPAGRSSTPRGCRGCPPRRRPPRPAGRLDPVKAAALPGWPAAPAGPAVRSRRAAAAAAPAMTEVGLPDLVAAAGYPSTRELSAWQSIGTLLLAKCARKPRSPTPGRWPTTQGLAFTLGLTALPKATHLGTYSWRVRRESNQKLLTGLVQALRPLGLATGEDGFNCDFHAIRHHGDQAVLEKHYVPDAPSAPAPCSPSSPRTTPPRTWCTPTPTSPRPSRPPRSSPSPTTGSSHRIDPACWSSTPS